MAFGGYPVVLYPDLLTSVFGICSTKPMGDLLKIVIME